MVIVTGANGFIGSVMVWELNRHNIPVSAVVDTVDMKARPELLANKKYQHFLHRDELWSFLEQPSTIKDTTWIIHMGANSSTTERDEEHLRQVNTLYTQRIFEWCTKHKKPMIYASSAATYGSGELGFDDTIDSEKLRPLNLYGESKVKFDRWAVKQTQTPPHWYGLKFFNVYGPNEYHKGPMSSLVYKSYHQIKDTNAMKLFKSYVPEYKDGAQMRDFVYVKDVVTWMHELMEKKPKSGIYNMGFGQARTWNDLAHAVFKGLGLKDNIVYVDMPDDLKNQYQYYTKANMQTWFSQGLSKPKWSLEKGVADYIENYLSKKDPVL